MMTIYKYPLPILDFYELSLPYGSQPLCVQAQFDSLMLWVLVNTTAPDVRWTFQVIGTGNPIPYESPGKYIGTVQMFGGELVWHVFGTESP